MSGEDLCKTVKIALANKGYKSKDFLNVEKNGESICNEQILFQLFDKN